MKKNFLFGVLALMLAGFWFGGASLADDLDCSDNAVANSGVIVCLNGTTGYDSLTGAINATNDNDTVTLLGDINSDVMVTVKTGITLNLNGHNLNFSSKFGFYFNGNINVTIEGSGSIVSSGSTIYSENCNLTINGGNIKSNYLGDENLYTLVLKNASGSINDGDFIAENKSSIRLTDNSSLTIDGGTFNAKEEVISMKNGTLTINNGEFTSTNLGVIYVNANTLLANIIINGGKFTSSTSTDGFIAYGLTASNAGAVTINGGTFDITNGAGIIARGGNVTLGSGVNFVFNNTNPSKSGMPASPMYGVEIPVGYELVMDLAFNLNNPDPVISGVPLTTTNNKTGTLLIVGDATTQEEHLVSIKNDDEFVPLTLTKSSTSAVVTKPNPDPTKDGYKLRGWYNGDIKYEDFNAIVSSDLALTAEWDEVIESIEIEGVVDPVAGATPFTGFTVTTGVVLNSTWTGDDDAAFDSFVAGSGYTLTIEIAADTGYVLSGTYTVKVNGESRAVSADTVSKTYQGKFKVTFDGENETLVESGATVTAPTVSKECNSLDGWYNGDEKVTFPLTVTGNLALTSKWTYTCSRSSGGGGGGSSKASSSNDTKATETAKADETKADEAKADEKSNEEDNNQQPENKAPMTDAEAVAKFGQEQIDAYKWALQNGITTMETVEDARLDQPLTRAELAKMMVVYIAKVLEKQPLLTGTVTYPDVTEKLGDLAGYIQLAYQYQIMGIDANGDPIEEFNPNGIVSRGEYATVFSRVLFGSLFNKEGADFYTDHLKALEAAGILTNTEPTIKEMRGWVMLMMYRSSKNIEAIEKVAAEVEATDEEVAEAEAKAEEETASEENNENTEATTGDVAEAPEAEATTGDVVEAPEAEATTGDVAEVPAEASTGDTASN